MPKTIKTTLSLLALALALITATIACSSARTGTDPAEIERRWHDLMEDVVSPNFDDVLLEQVDREPESMDYVAISRAADEMATAIAQGYGPLEQSSIPGFAQLAHDAEDWLRQIQRSAVADDGDTVRQLVANGEAVHCEVCHQRADDVQ